VANPSGRQFRDDGFPDPLLGGEAGRGGALPRARQFGAVGKWDKHTFCDKGGA